MVILKKDMKTDYKFRKNTSKKAVLLTHGLWSSINSQTIIEMERKFIAKA
jgi:hypothetical protein